MKKYTKKYTCQNEALSQLFQTAGEQMAEDYGYSYQEMLDKQWSIKIKTTGKWIGHLKQVRVTVTIFCALLIFALPACKKDDVKPDTLKAIPAPDRLPADRDLKPQYLRP